MITIYRTGRVTPETLGAIGGAFVIPALVVSALLLSIVSPVPLPADPSTPPAGEVKTGSACDLLPLFDPEEETLSMQTERKSDQRPVRPPLDLAIPDTLRTATFALG